jgi:hypothetical protein
MITSQDDGFVHVILANSTLKLGANTATKYDIIEPIPDCRLVAQF